MPHFGVTPPIPAVPSAVSMLSDDLLKFYHHITHAMLGDDAQLMKALERVLYLHLPAYWANLQAVLDNCLASNMQVKADGHKVYGAIPVAVERLLKMKEQPGIHRDGANTNVLPEGPVLSLHRTYAELDFFGNSLDTRFGAGTPAVPPPDCTCRTAHRERGGGRGTSACCCCCSDHQHHRITTSLAEIPPSAVADPLVNKSGPPAAPRVHHCVRPVMSRSGCPGADCGCPNKSQCFPSLSKVFWGAEICSSRLSRGPRRLRPCTFIRWGY
ncbi:uncharacterized protein [Patagioenas fasciata]|uniref:uncharacterized protein isoform X3 n=1 Tax=Patagioenas fasciata TaxID=372321 RepID=UPI003A99876A